MGDSANRGRILRNIAYSPLPSQQRFHKSEARFKGFSGSIGSGKSQALCQEAIRLSYLNAGRTGLIGAPTYPMLRDATLTSLLEVLRANELPFEHNKAENVLTLPDTGSRILLRSLDEYERLRGTNLAWFGVDELTYTAEEAWLRLEGRLRDPHATRLCGFAVWTPKGHDWVYERFVQNESKCYDVVLAKSFENRHILDKIPDFYERLKSTYDDVFYRQEVLGEYLGAGSSLVYHAFSRDDHVREVRSDAARPLLWALDFNVDPMCSIVAQRQGEQLAVLDEIVLSRAGTYQACEEFWNRYRQHAGGVVVFGDASGQSTRTSGSSDYKIIREFFARTPYRRVEYRVPSSNPMVRDRVLAVNSKLRNASGDVSIWVSPRCKELIKDLEQVAYKSGSTIIDKERDPKRTHLSDALGYLVWQEWRSPVRSGEQGMRLL
ncbi:MAG TPA: phage terminase large subunit [Bryobacteraceae bacterium]|nr:phage terminase large subunit [Bryobacteraceae bacterium]